MDKISEKLQSLLKRTIESKQQQLHPNNQQQADLNNNNSDTDNHNSNTAISSNCSSQEAGPKESLFEGLMKKAPGEQQQQQPQDSSSKAPQGAQESAAHQFLLKENSNMIEHYRDHHNHLQSQERQQQQQQQHQIVGQQQAGQAADQRLIEQYLARQQQHQHHLAMEHLRTISSCSSSSSSGNTSNGSSSNGRNSSIGDHCFLEPFEHMLLLGGENCATSSSSNSSTTSTTTSSSANQLFGRLSRRLRILDSPSDSGLESGKENGSYSALGFSDSNSLMAAGGLRSTTPNELPSSACMSPVNGHHNGQANGLGHHHHHGQAAFANSNSHSYKYLSLDAGDHPAPPANRFASCRPASAMGHLQPGKLKHHSSTATNGKLADHGEPTSVATSGSIDDMPMLKRALQAPPLINTNMLMDEAYRHHKKFRAAQRKENGGSGGVCSSSGAAINGYSTAHNTPPRSPSPTNQTASQRRALARPDSAMANYCSGAGSQQSSSALANMHSTLLKKLNQPSNLQLSQQQLKCQDLIHEIILHSDELHQHKAAAAATNGAGPLNDKPKAQAATSPIPSGALAPASSPVSPPATSAQEAAERKERLAADSNLHRILISGQQKQQPQANGSRQAKLLGGLSHHLIDEDYIAKRLLNSGAYHRHQAQHAGSARATANSHSNSQPAAHNHHRPSSSCASSSSSPSPTSISPDLCGHHHAHHNHSAPSSGRFSSMMAMSTTPHGSMLLANGFESPTVPSLAPSQPTSSYQYIDQHLSYHQQQQERLLLQRVQQQQQLSLMVPGAGQQAAASNAQQMHNLLARSPISPLSSCDGAYNGISSTFSSASPSPTSPRIVASAASSCHFTNSLNGTISKLSLHCNGSNSNSAFPSALAQDNQLLLQQQQQQPSHHLVSGAAKLSLLQQNQRAVVASEGGFGLLADVAIAAAEAAEEQSRLEQQVVQQAEQAAAAAAQPIDLSKK